MQVRFDEIPAGGLRLDITEASWFPADVCQRIGPLSATVSLERRDSRVFLQGQLRGKTSLECDRCLVSYGFALDTDFSIEVELLDRDAVALADAEHACHPSEMEVLFVSEPCIDVFEILSQQVILTLPVKRLCSETCQGLCARCGVNLNQGSCICESGAADSPFAVLKRLQ